VFPCCCTARRRAGQTVWSFSDDGAGVLQDIVCKVPSVLAPDSARHGPPAIRASDPDRNPFHLGGLADRRHTTCGSFSVVTRYRCWRSGSLWGPGFALNLADPVARTAAPWSVRPGVAGPAAASAPRCRSADCLAGSRRTVRKRGRWHGLRGARAAYQQVARESPAGGGQPAWSGYREWGPRARGPSPQPRSVRIRMSPDLRRGRAARAGPRALVIPRPPPRGRRPRRRALPDAPLRLLPERDGRRPAAQTGAESPGRTARFSA